MNFMTFHSVGKFIIPTDELIFFRGVGQPPTSGFFIVGLAVSGDGNGWSPRTIAGACSLPCSLSVYET